MLDCNLKDNSLIQINIEGEIGEIEGTPSEASVWADKLKASLARAVYVGVGLPLEMWANKKEEQRKRISEAVDRNAASIPPECRIEPTFGEVRAIVNGLEGCIDEELLENGFINLLEASMDSRRASGLIKNYAVVLNQLCPDEAKILSYVFSVRTFPVLKIKEIIEGSSYSEIASHVTNLDQDVELQYPKELQLYLEHLQTLGLLEISWSGTIANEECYEKVMQSPSVVNFKRSYEEKGKVLTFSKGYLSVTHFGDGFARACRFAAKGAKKDL